MKLFTLILLLLTTKGYGMGCSYPDAVMEQLSNKYGYLIDVRVNQMGGSYHITVELPSIINNSQFHGLAVVKEQIDNKKEIFVFSVAMIDKGESKEGWFNIDRELFDNIFLYVSYGTDCPFSVRKHIDVPDE